MSTSRSKQQLTQWLQRNDWAMHIAASEAVDTTDALKEGVPEIGRTQFRAILNTARVCDNPKTFKRFLDKRRKRREKEARNSNRSFLKKKAAFWGELMSQLRTAGDHARTAADTVGDLSKSDQMRVVEVYFTHLIAHCQLRSKG